MEVAQTGSMESSQTHNTSNFELKWAQVNAPKNRAAKTTPKVAQRPSGLASEPGLSRKHKKLLKKKEKRRAKRESQTQSLTSPPKTQTDRQTEKPGPSTTKAIFRKTVLETKATGQSEKESGQDKGKTKRARLDETLSPRGEPKKPRLTPAQDTRSPTYAEATSADKPKAKLVITSATGYITKETAVIVEKHLDDAFIATARRQIMTVEGPIFMRRPTSYDGSLRLYCENQEAVEWTVGVCSELDLPGVGKLTVTDAKDIPKMVRCGIRLPHEHDGDQVLIGMCLRLGNPWAQVERWRVHTIIPQDKATFVVRSVCHKAEFQPRHKQPQQRYCISLHA
ncbi:uncharacterized protein LOC126966736 [Leptidea sinapis]|uniref:uncharacterized protein LOC126966736 n=1 Tax=Leptidea sinapis TaxID=189913 RepID=UPI0021C42890|nr:uncharacterized protein LOC126966736 [Leptidea sinapis]XP_050666961.1 uncharacterized protein LOC126966736 [Leptidea sinapis]